MTPADPIAYALKYHVQNAREPQWCEHCEEAWPCVTKMLADRVSLYGYHYSMMFTDFQSIEHEFKTLQTNEQKDRKKHSPKRSRKK